MQEHLSYLAGQKIPDAHEIVSGGWAGGNRVAFYECECGNIQAYGHHEAEINSDSIGTQMGEDEQCYGCGADAEQMTMISIYDRELSY